MFIINPVCFPTPPLLATQLASPIPAVSHTSLPNLSLPHFLPVSFLSLAPDNTPQPSLSHPATSPSWPSLLQFGQGGRAARGAEPDLLDAGCRSGYRSRRGDQCGYTEGRGQRAVGIMESGKKIRAECWLAGWMS